MPVLETHHKYVICDNDNKKLTLNLVNNIVTDVIQHILAGSPSVVAEVACGRETRDVLDKMIIKYLDEKMYHNGLYRNEIIKKVFDYMFGYGELQQYIEDEDISDIDGTSHDDFVIKKNGVRQKIDVAFPSEKSFETYCKLIAVRNGGILNENDSHCRVTDLKSRLRINVSIRPRNVSGASISIRKHRFKSYSLEDLKRLGMLDQDSFIYLKNTACSNKSVIFCGKGAAGKTTLLRAFINELPEMERVLIAESDAELYPDKKYCIQQKVKKPQEGGRTIRLDDLIRDGLTMSLDTYCVGEIVGEEAWDFIKAGFTGHRVLATVHAKNCEDAIDRLCMLCDLSKINCSEHTIKSIICRSIDVIVFVKNFKVYEIIEYTGNMSDKADVRNLKIIKRKEG